MLYLCRLLFKILNLSYGFNAQTDAIARALKVTISTLPPGDLKTRLQDCDLRDVASRLGAVIQDSASIKPDDGDAVNSKAQKKRRKVGSALDINKDDNSLLLLAMDTSYAAEIAQCLSQSRNKSKASLVSHDPMLLLLARSPPPQGYVEWLLNNVLLQRNESSQGKEEDESSTLLRLLESFETGLRLCNAVAGHSEYQDSAVAVFKPLVLHLQRMMDIIRLEDNAKYMDRKYQTQVKSYLAQIFACIYLIIKEKEKSGAVGEDDRRSKQWLSWPNTSSFQEATDVCFLLVSLRYKARLYWESEGLKGLASKNDTSWLNSAQHDFQLLSPFAAFGFLSNAQENSLEKITSMSDVEKQCFIAFYMSLAKDTLLGFNGITTERLYFQKLLAARKAATAATALGKTMVSARILSEAAATVAPSQAMDWLHAQPPSSAVMDAIQSLEFGPQNLSSHLVYTATERVVQAFAVASTSGVAGIAGPSEQTPGTTLEVAQPGDAVSDLLYYVSTEGDATMFGRPWGDGTDDDDGDSSSDGGVHGIDLDELEQEVQEDEYSEKEGEDYED